MTDRFPEAFRRFEEDVNVNQFESFRQLRLAFGHWAGRRWRPTYKQDFALRHEARRLGIPLDGLRKIRSYYFPSATRVSWKIETFKIKGKTQQRYRDVKTGRFIKEP